MTSVSDGAYALSNAWQQARERLALLEDELDPATQRRLLACGVTAGWHCLEVGAGGGSIAHWLCRQVGRDGRVLATDIDTTLVAVDAPSNLELATPISPPPSTASPRSHPWPSPVWSRPSLGPREALSWRPWA